MESVLLIYLKLGLNIDVPNTLVSYDLVMVIKFSDKFLQYIYIYIAALILKYQSYFTRTRYNYFMFDHVFIARYFRFGAIFGIRNIFVFI